MRTSARADLRGISSSLSSAELFGARYDADTLWPGMDDPKRTGRGSARIRAEYEALIREHSADARRIAEYARERAVAAERARREHVEYLAATAAADGPVGNLAAYLQDIAADRLKRERSSGARPPRPRRVGTRTPRSRCRLRLGAGQHPCLVSWPRSYRRTLRRDAR